MLHSAYTYIPFILAVGVAFIIWQANGTYTPHMQVSHIKKKILVRWMIVDRESEGEAHAHEDVSIYSKLTIANIILSNL